MSLNAYELELKVLDRASRTARTVTRTEYAHSALDAFQLALLNQNAAELGHADITLVRIGPPAAEVAAASSELARRIAERVRKATG